MSLPDAELEELLNSGYRYALSLSRDKATAEDVLQDAWVAIIQAKGPRTKAYLFCAIRSRFLNFNKREQLVSIVPLDDHIELTANEPDDDYAHIDTEIIFTAINTLRSLEREALFLMAVEGYTAQEIADFTQQPRGTVLSLIHRAKIKIKRYIKQKKSEVMP